ncbi:MAG: ABC transporter permease [Nitrospinota bacterium]
MSDEIFARAEATESVEEVGDDGAKGGFFRLLAYRLAFGLVILFLWQFASDRIVDSYWVSKPTRVFDQLMEMVVSKEIFVHFFDTMINTFWGYVLGAIVGICIGFLLAEYQTVASVLEPYIMAFNGVPRIAYAPLFIVWFGIERESKVILVATIVFFLTFTNTFAGIRGVSVDLVNVARIMGGRKLGILRKVILPSAAPWIINGLKVSLPFSLVGAIVGEFIAASSGLGYLLQLYMNLYNTTGVILIILILMATVIFLNIVLNAIEGHLLRWRPVTEQKEVSPS